MYDSEGKFVKINKISSILLRKFNEKQKENIQIVDLVFPDLINKFQDLDV